MPDWEWPLGHVRKALRTEPTLEGNVKQGGHLYRLVLQEKHSFKAAVTIFFQVLVLAILLTGGSDSSGIQVTLKLSLIY